MKRRVAVSILALAVVVLGALWGAKRFGAFGPAQAPGAVPASPPATKAAKAPEPAVSRPMLLGASDLLPVTKVELARAAEVTGTLKAVRSAFVKARVAGEILAITVREGEAVRAGQEVVRIDPTELDLRIQQAEQNARAARAQLDIAQRASANSRALVGRGFVSPTALDTALANESAAQATLDAAQTAVSLARKARADATLVAPLSGVVAQRLAQPGERIGVDGRVLEIVDLSRLEIEAAVPAEVAAPLRIGAPARLRVDGIDDWLDARVARINPSTQSGTRALLVYLEVQSHPALRQGMFARGRITIESRTALAVPLSAVRIDQAQPYLLAIETTAGDAARVVQLAVQLGMRGEHEGTDYVEITAGASEGARVLAERAGAMRPGTLVTLPASAPAAATESARAPAAAPAAAPVPASR